LHLELSKVLDQRDQIIKTGKLHKKNKQINILMPAVQLDETSMEKELRSRLDQYHIDTARTGSSQMSQCSRARCLDQYQREKVIKEYLNQ